MKKKMKMLIMGGMLALMAMPVKAQKWEGLADTPQMGWSTWNKFQGNISEDVIRGIADVMARFISGADLLIDGGCTASYWYGDLQYLKTTH